MSQVDHYKKLRKRIDSYIGKYPLPSKEENNNSFKELRRLKKLNNKSLKYKKLRDTIIIRNGGFGMKYAIAYCKKINDDSIIEDIFQQAQMGIIEAVDRFDPSREVNFTTFAWHHLKKCIIDFIKCNKVVSAPRGMARNIRNVSETRDKLYTEKSGEKSTPTEIKERLIEDKGIELNEKMIKDVVHLIELNSAAHNETFITTLTEDIVYMEEHELYTKLESSLLKELVGMDDELLELVKMRFGIDTDRPYSLSEIAILKDLTPEKIEHYKEKTKIFLNNKKENNYELL